MFTHYIFALKEFRIFINGGDIVIYKIAIERQNILFIWVFRFFKICHGRDNHEIEFGKSG